MPEQQRLIRTEAIHNTDIVSSVRDIWKGTTIAPSRQDIAFDKDFAYRLALSEADQRAAWRLRYHIYCEDSGFLPKEEHSDGLEKDSHDVHSHQALLIHQSSRQLAGTVRLILPQCQDEGMALPALTHAPALRHHSAPWRSSANVGEVSRFSIDPRFRVRAGQAQKPAGLSTMLLGLVLAALDMARTHHIDHLVALVDPILVRLLHRIGVYWQPIGPTVYYHGFRQPSHIDCAQAMDLLAERYPAAIHHLQEFVRGGQICSA